MAFCNNRTCCNHSCGRQDDHGGDCDCYESDCRASSRYNEPVAVACVAPPGPPLATFYAIAINGQYYDGSCRYIHGEITGVGVSDDLNNAKTWTKAGPAKARITALSANGPVPDLVELFVTAVNVVNQEKRVAAFKAKKDRESAAYIAARKEQMLLDAERDLDLATARLKKVKES